MDDPERIFRGMIYGDFGMGKTHLAYQIFEELEVRRLLHVTSDSAWVTGLKFELSLRTDRIPFRGHSQIRTIVEARQAGVSPWCDYDAFLWDTVTTAHENVIDKTVELKKFSDQIDPDAASWTHYNITKMSLRRAIELLTKTDMHIIYLGHLREPSQKEIDEGKRQKRPNMPEKTFKLIAQEVQLLGWLHPNRQKQRVLHVQPSDLVAAKSTLTTISIETPEYPANSIPPLIKNWKDRK